MEVLSKLGIDLGLGLDINLFALGNLDDEGNLEDDGNWDSDTLAALSGRTVQYRSERQNSSDQQFVDRATAVKEIIDDFSAFDVPQQFVKPIPTHLLKYFYKSSSVVKFTELFCPQPRTKKRTADEFYPPSPTQPILPVEDETEESLPELSETSSKQLAPPKIARRDEDVWLSRKVKYKQPACSRYTVPLGPEIGVGQYSTTDFVFPLAKDVCLLDQYNWEDSILWDDETEDCPSLTDKPLHVDWSWDDSAIIWDDTKQTRIPIPRILVDPQLFGVSFVPRKKLKNVDCSGTFTLQLDPTRPDVGPMPIRKRLSAVSSLVSHSSLATSLTLVPWQMSDAKARDFHRPKWLFPPGRVPVIFVQPPMHRHGEPPQNRHYTNWTQSDLSAAENLIILVEYTEQHPPILQNVGMSSKLRSYFAQTTEDDIATDLPPGDIGENFSLDPDDASPFLGKIPPGERMYGIENKLYKAAMFEAPPVSKDWVDYLLVRTISNQWRLRKIPKTFVVGQTLPLQKVPSPSSKTAMLFSRNRLKRYINENLRLNSRISLQDVKNMFPNETDPAMRNVLKEYCDFTRLNNQAWLLLPNVELVSDANLRALTSPEEVCLNESSQAGLLRLKDMGICRFNNPYALSEAADALKEEVTRNALSEIEKEIQLMPWNSTATFCDVMRGRLRPSVAGSDTDLNNQFAFARTRTDARAIKSNGDFEKSGRLADGSDLRKVSLADAQKFLRDAGEPEQSFAKLKRWALIDKMRDKATEMAEAGNKEAQVLKYARPNIDNSNVRQQEFDKRAQTVFDRMVKYCRGLEEFVESDMAFEKELEALFDQVVVDNPTLVESDAPKPKRRKNQGKRRAKRTKKSDISEKDEAQLLEDLRNRPLADGDCDMGTIVGTLQQGKPARTSGKIIRKTCTYINADGSVTRTIEWIRDPAQVAYHERKKRNLEQKRSNIETNAADLLLLEKDRFFKRFFNYCNRRLSEFNLPKSKQASINSKTALLITPNQKERNWPNNCLFISLYQLELETPDSIVLGTPSVRCGKHAPPYRSYKWRRDRWTRLDNYMVIILMKLSQQVISWKCQHREHPSGPVCGAIYLDVENELHHNKKLVQSLFEVSQRVSEKLAEGSFMPLDLLKSTLEKFSDK